MTHSNDNNNNNNNSDRLTRIENLVESNARSIQAIMEQQVTDRLRHEEIIAEIRQLNANHDQRIQLLENVSSRLADVQLGMARMER